MILIFGYTSYGGEHSLDATPTDINNITTGVTAEKTVAGGLFLTKETCERKGEHIPPISEWNFDTILNAPLNGNLLGGNVNFTAEQILCMRLKRAEADTYRWLTLFEIPITSNDDLSFTRNDLFARGNQDYKYALVPVWNDNIEGNYNINTVHSTFEGVWMMEKSMGIQAVLNLDVTTIRNIVTSLVTPLGRKYPYVNQYGKANYTSGSFDATFIHYSEAEEDWEVDNAVKYREIVEEFLTNGNPKIIKHEDGRIWLASVAESIPKNESAHVQNPVQTVNFIEIGYYESSSDLYDANLIDVNIEGGRDDGILSYSI